MPTSLDNDPSFMKIRSFEKDGRIYDVYASDDSHHAMLAVRRLLDDEIGSDCNCHDADGRPAMCFLKRENPYDCMMVGAYGLWMRSSWSLLFMLVDGMLCMIGNIIGGFDGLASNKGMPYVTEWYSVGGQCMMPLNLMSWDDERFTMEIAMLDADCIPGNVFRDRMSMPGNSVFERRFPPYRYRRADICIGELNYMDLKEMKPEAFPEINGLGLLGAPGPRGAYDRADRMIDVMCSDKRPEARMYLARNTMLNDCCWKRLSEDPDPRVRRTLLAWLPDKYLAFNQLDGLLADVSYDVRFTAAVMLLEAWIELDSSWFKDGQCMVRQRATAFLENGYDDDFKPYLLDRVLCMR